MCMERIDRVEVLLEPVTQWKVFVKINDVLSLAFRSLSDAAGSWRVEVDTPYQAQTHVVRPVSQREDLGRYLTGFHAFDGKVDAEAYMARLNEIMGPNLVVRRVRLSGLGYYGLQTKIARYHYGDWGGTPDPTGMIPAYGWTAQEMVVLPEEA